MNLKIEMTLGTAVVLIVWALAWMIRGIVNSTPKTVNNNFHGSLPLTELKPEPESFQAPAKLQ